MRKAAMYRDGHTLSFGGGLGRMRGSLPLNERFQFAWRADKCSWRKGVLVGSHPAGKIVGGTGRCEQRGSLHQPRPHSLWVIKCTETQRLNLKPLKKGG